MCVHPHHCFRHDQFTVKSPLIELIDVEPFFKTFDECLFCYRFGLFTAYTAAEHIVKTAATTEKAGYYIKIKG